MTTNRLALLRAIAGVSLVTVSALALADLTGSVTDIGGDKTATCQSAKSKAAQKMELNRMLEGGKDVNVKGRVTGCECTTDKPGGLWTCGADWSLEVTKK